jgi:hypothetical protein
MEKGNFEGLGDHFRLMQHPLPKAKELIEKLPRIMEIESEVCLENVEHREVLNFGQPFALGLLWDGLWVSQRLEAKEPLEHALYNRFNDILAMDFSLLF